MMLCCHDSFDVAVMVCASVIVLVCLAFIAWLIWDVWGGGENGRD